LKTSTDFFILPTQTSGDSNNYLESMSLSDIIVTLKQTNNTTSLYNGRLAAVAQWIEQLPPKEWVARSIRAGGTIFAHRLPTVFEKSNRPTPLTSS
jgi:hypothetical protein